ncbi:MAG: hypothetical protein KDB03_00310 [Planctomycetales bacterium]|nr:hypothetical protein [Planctomycetales bacterium]
MSEYQLVEFRAVDAPLNDAALEFMCAQSTRAEVNRWKFTNEYHYGDFRGNVLEMMRRGYDVHVHYTNFGLRRIGFRIPDGFPHAERLKPYLYEPEIQWTPDKKGTGGVLMLEPCGDAGTWDWMDDIDDLASDLIPVRELILAGDFRALYLAHIAFNYDDGAVEPPVPPGLAAPHRGLIRLTEFYEISFDLISVAAEKSIEFPSVESDDEMIGKWVANQATNELADHLANCLKRPRDYPNQLLRIVRRVALKSLRVEQPGNRTIEELRQQAADIAAERQTAQEEIAASKAEERKVAAEKVKQATLSAIASNPEKSIQRIDAAIEERNRPAYQRAAEELQLLAEACGKSTAAAKVEMIRKTYPTRSALDSILREAGF